MENKLKRLGEIAGEVFELHRIAAVLDWDQQVGMPHKAAVNRARQVSLLHSLAHEKFTGSELGDLLAALTPELSNFAPDSDANCLIRRVERDYRRQKKVPPGHVAEFSNLTSLAHTSWEKARTESDFKTFSPLLSRIFEMRREYAGFFAPFDHIYDPLLDEFEPGMKTAEVIAVFDSIRPAQVELLHKIKACPEPDLSCLRHEFASDKQWQLSREAAAVMGYDFERGRLDSAMHPFTTTFNLNDVRITSAVNSRNLSSLSSTMHEAGHAIYEQNISPALENTPLATGASLGIHESQSRLWENLVGRSWAFLTYFYPRIQAAFPVLEKVSQDEFYRAYNAVKPGFIRVNADEATYNLHIMLRFELELAILEDDLEVADLPEAWNAKMKDYLDLTPPDDAHGCLQDVHWSAGLVGYFPTYALGNLISAQLWETCDKVMGGGVLEAAIAAGDFSKLRSWLGENIHRHGSKFDSMDLLKRVCGTGLEPDAYIKYLRRKYFALYGF